MRLLPALPHLHTCAVTALSRYPAHASACPYPPPGMDVWHLAATEQLTATCKSLVLAAALVRGAIGPGEALAAARLEEDFQAEEWGRVEAGHDLDEADIRSRLFGPSVFLRLLQLR